MKLIEQIKLSYKKGTSDKVYEIDLCEVEGGYVVNFRYGKRGAKLKAGSKTSRAVSLEKAQKVFQKLADDKKRKGYISESQPYKFQKFDSMEEVVLQRLKDKLEDTKSFKTEWKTSRVAWKVGEIRLQKAVPYLVQLLDNAENDMIIYSILWALVRCKDEQAFDTFQRYATNQESPTIIRNIALEGLLSTSSEAEKQGLIQNFIEKLPATIKKYVLEHQTKALQKHLLARIAEKQKKYDFLYYLYFLSSEYQFLQKILAQVLAQIPLRPPHFKHVRAIYKLAELRDDRLILGVLAYRFEKIPEMYTKGNSWSNYVYVPELNQSVHLNSEINKSNPKIAFSNKTKDYFQRKNLRIINQLGEQNPTNFVKLATSILLSYSEQDYRPAYTEGSYGRWNRRNQNYEHTFTVYPPCADSALLGTILYGNDKSLKINGLKWQKSEKIQMTSNSWYASSPELPETFAQTPIQKVRNWDGKNPAENRFELYPEAWDKMPLAYVQLLMQGKINFVHEFAYKNLKSHPDFQQISKQFDKNTCEKLLASNFEIPAFFGVELIKTRLQEELDKNLIIILVRSKVAEGRKLGLDTIWDNAHQFTDDTNLIYEFLVSDYEDVRWWTHGFLEKAILTENQYQILVGKAISEMLSGEISDTIKQSIKPTLKTYTSTILKKLSWDVVLQLLHSDNLENQIFASDLLVMKLDKISASDVPFSILEEFFKSESATIRANGMRIFSQYPESKLLEAKTLLGNMLLSPYDNLRTASLQIINQLVTKNQEFAQYMVDILFVALRRKEPFEGAHEFSKNLLLNDLKAFLGDVPLQTTLRFLHGNYREGQLFGFYLLENHTDITQITMRQIIAIANHEVVKIRFWALDFYKSHIARIRYERDEALRILDAKWDDIRAEAMQFFRENFTENDWDTDSLVSIADSVKSDVEAFSKELITKFFQEKDGAEYLTKLSQHPSPSMQLFSTNYLEGYATQNLERLQEMEFYFRSVLMRVNQGRLAKNRILSFLENEAQNSEQIAIWFVKMLNDLVATSAVQDKERFIHILQNLKNQYPNLNVSVIFEEFTLS